MRILFTLLCLLWSASLLSAQSFTELLGRPTDVSVTVNILFDQEVEVYWEFGTSPNTYPQQTPTFSTSLNLPLEADLTALKPNTRYYYRTRYRAKGSTGAFWAGTERSFQTQRSQTSTFSFAVEADPHLDENTIPASYSQTLKHIFSKQPDFLIDLGDIFMSEKLPVINQEEITKRHLLYRPYFNEVSHSVPLFLAMGNHEGELGWRLDGKETSLPVMAANTRKLYYPNPVPNHFYSGNTVSENFVGLRENYYAWEWGNALFIVLDPYWYTVKKPEWGWTLGQAQYNWLRNTLATSKATFKFVFAHQLLAGGNEGRGGTEVAHLHEMGGQNTDGSWGFSAQRPGWEKPIHELLKATNVSIYFHGHDHFYGKQDKDGVVYQEVPQPSSRNITNVTGLEYGYKEGILRANRGYLLVTVSPTQAKVEYIRTYLPNEENASRKNGDIEYTYTIQASAVSNEETPLPIFDLAQNFPNPYQQATNISYTIFSAQQVKLQVFDVLGRKVATLVEDTQSAGTYTIPINAPELGLQSGVYLYRLTVGQQTQTRKMSVVH